MFTAKGHGVKNHMLRFVSGVCFRGHALGHISGYVSRHVAHVPDLVSALYGAIVPLK